MSTVYNWQLGRGMQYPYEEARPDRQFAFVFNTNRCIACQTCTMACKSTWTFSKGQEHMWWTDVETKPYGGYPQNWDVKILQLLDEAHRRREVKPGWSGAAGSGGARAPYGTYGGLTVFEGAKGSGFPDRVLGYLPEDEKWRVPNIREDSAVARKGVRNEYDPEGVTLPEHKTWFFYLARLCNHCSYPACLAACPRKAIYKRKEDGIVLIDQCRCRGYRKCVQACPYKKSLYRPTTRVSEKCIACYPRIEGRDPATGGRPTETRCMSACIGQIRLQGLVSLEKDGQWKEDPQNPLYYLVKIAKVALPLYPQFGTEPNGYYIPPRWVPRSYLRQMFGSVVDQALGTYKNPDRELLAVLQLFRKSNVIIDRYELVNGDKVYETEINGKPFAMYDDNIIAYDREGKQIIRTKIEEPVHVRPGRQQNSI